MLLSIARLYTTVSTDLVLAGSVINLNTNLNPLKTGKYSTFFLEKMAIFRLLGLAIPKLASFQVSGALSLLSMGIYFLERRGSIPYSLFESRVPIIEDGKTSQPKIEGKIATSEDSSLAVVERIDKKRGVIVKSGLLSEGLQLAANAALIYSGRYISGGLGLAFTIGNMLSARAHLFTFLNGTGSNKTAQKVHQVLLKVKGMVGHVHTSAYNAISSRYPSAVLSLLGVSRVGIDEQKPFLHQVNKLQAKALVEGVDDRSIDLLIEKKHYMVVPKEITKYSNTQANTINGLRYLLDQMGVMSCNREKKGIGRIFEQMQIEDRFSGSREEVLKQLTFILNEVKTCCFQKHFKKVRTVLKSLSQIHELSDKRAKERLLALVKAFDGTEKKEDNTLRNRVVLLVRDKRVERVDGKNAKYLEALNNTARGEFIDSMDDPASKALSLYDTVSKFDSRYLLFKVMSFLGLSQRALDHYDNVAMNIKPLKETTLDPIYQVKIFEYFSVWLRKRVVDFLLLDKTKKKEYIITPDDYITYVHDSLYGDNTFLDTEVSAWKISYLQSVGEEEDSHFSDMLTGRNLVKVLLVDLGILKVDSAPELAFEAPSAVRWMIRKVPKLEGAARILYGPKVPAERKELALPN